MLVQEIESRLTDKNLLDPPLVRDGKFQAIEMGDRLKTWWSANQTGQIELVISSPLTRCLQTATLAFLPGDRYANEINEPRMTCVESIREAYGMHYPDQRRKKSFLMVSIVVVQSYHCQLISSTSLTPFVVAVAINSL
jgi:broad specificity phosphatase PhoE